MSKTKKFLTGTAILTLTTLATYTAVTNAPEVEATPEVVITTPEGCHDYACLLEERTSMVYGRDINKYMEQARLTAMQELNEEAQELVYESPYDNNN